MPLIVWPKCALCGMPDPYTCRECGLSVCGDCFGPYGECQHQAYVAWKGNYDGKRAE